MVISRQKLLILLGESELVKDIIDLLKKSAERIWREILNHPFVQELYKGTLPLEKFKFYVSQDYNYLIGMMKTFSLIAAKADYETARISLEIAYLDATIEMENYKKLLKELDLTLEEVIKIEPAPTNFAYMNFLVSTAATEQPIYALTATLPCFWSYLYIAEHYKDLLSKNPSKIYRSWASAYISEEYRELVELLKETVRRLYREEHADLEKMKRLFIIGSRYELMFWNMSYNMEKWII